MFNRIDNSLIDTYLEGDSYMAKASGTGMTNRKALHVSLCLYVLEQQEMTIWYTRWLMARFWRRLNESFVDSRATRTSLLR